jgi:hypothetical protein
MQAPSHALNAATREAVPGSEMRESRISAAAAGHGEVDAALAQPTCRAHACFGQLFVGRHQDAVHVGDDEEIALTAAFRRARQATSRRSGAASRSMSHTRSP